MQNRPLVAGSGTQDNVLTVTGTGTGTHSSTDL